MKRRPFLRTLRPGQVRADEREDIREELELYLELRADELEAEGMSADEARRVARERFGDTTRIESELRRQARRRSARPATSASTRPGLRWKTLTSSAVGGNIIAVLIKEQSPWSTAAA